MNTEVEEFVEVPAALPISEQEVERDRVFDQSTDAELIADEEFEDDEFDDLDEQLAKPSKKKLFFAFVCLVFGFVFLIGLLSWFFGIGIFAATKTQAVDRTAKDRATNSSTTPVSEEEKLKIALNLVAEKEKNGQAKLSNGDADENLSDDPSFNSSVDIPSTKAADVTEPVIIPDSVSEANRNRDDSFSPATNVGPNNSQNSPVRSERQNASNVYKTNALTGESESVVGNTPLGRSLFFGVERKNSATTKTPPQGNNQTIGNRVSPSSEKIKVGMIPFGTLLPVRFLGAVYTLRTSGGLVRLELTRPVSGKNYSYPAGTVLVGRLRGSEYKRAFISVFGLIDSKTNRLVKFGGEVMGADGASGVIGRRRKVKSAWSRILGGLRDAGALALGTISNRRSGGGTVIISDSISKASGPLTEELSGIVGNNGQSNEFIEIAAGTNAFVQVTDLPDEISNTENIGQTAKSATGLDTSELADLFSEGSPEQIRAALPKMTPEFRSLAEKVLANQR